MAWVSDLHNAAALMPARGRHDDLAEVGDEPGPGLGWFRKTLSGKSMGVLTSSIRGPWSGAGLISFAAAAG
jgi:hypothetical protein